MDRRSFVVAAGSFAGATTLGLGATASAAAAVAVGAPPSGRWVRVGGLLGRCTPISNHYLILTSAGGRDPDSEDPAQWPHGAIRIYPADVAMKPGRTALVGKLFVGHFRDIVSGHAAGAVMIDARPAKS